MSTRSRASVAACSVATLGTVGCGAAAATGAFSWPARSLPVAAAKTAGVAGSSITRLKKAGLRSLFGEVDILDEPIAGVDDGDALLFGETENDLGDLGLGLFDERELH